MGFCPSVDALSTLLSKNTAFGNKKNLSFIFSGEPNNDSPLNTQAAGLWANQVAYKKLLHEKYEADAKKST